MRIDLRKLFAGYLPRAACLITKATPNSVEIYSCVNVSKELERISRFEVMTANLRLSSSSYGRDTGNMRRGDIIVYFDEAPNSSYNMRWSVANTRLLKLKPNLDIVKISLPAELLLSKLDAYMIDIGISWQGVGYHVISADDTMTQSPFYLGGGGESNQDRSKLYSYGVHGELRK